MSFLYPAFLFALLSLMIPVIIHFFNFKRYKTLYFSNVTLLKLIRQESKKKSQLKHIFILIARLLALATLVFAFSKPFIPYSSRKIHATLQRVAIYIDNSFSMKAEGEKGPLLEQARMKAIEITNSYQPGTQFLLITNDLLPQHQFFLDKSQFIQQVSELKESPFAVKLSAIYKHVGSLFQNSGKITGNTFYLLSDFQKNTADFEAIKPDSTLYSYLLPFNAGKIDNLLIDSCWFDVPGRKIGQQEKIHVSIKNLSAKAYQNIPVRLFINDSLKAISTANLSANDAVTLDLNYTNNSGGIQLCKIALDDYPIIYDNTYYLSYLVRDKLEALGITNSNAKSPDYLDDLFDSDELVVYHHFPENNIQISQLKDQQCIFLINNELISSGLKNELVSWVNDGGSLAIFPEDLKNYDSYNDLLSALNSKTITEFDTAATGISEINYENELYRDAFKQPEKEADLPVIKGSVVFNSHEFRPETVLLRLTDGRSALTVHSFGNGKVYVFAFPLNAPNLNFIRHLIFVPTVYNMVLNSGFQQKYSYPINSNEPVLLNSGQSGSGQITVKNMQSGEEFLASVRVTGNGQKTLSMEDIPRMAGHYLILENSKPAQAISYNYSRQESVAEFYTTDELKGIAHSNPKEHLQVIDSVDSNFAETLQDLNNGKQLWKYFIGLSIFFLLCEIAIVRFWK